MKILYHINNAISTAKTNGGKNIEKQPQILQLPVQKTSIFADITMINTQDFITNPSEKENN